MLDKSIKLDWIAIANHMWFNRITVGPLADWDVERQKMVVMNGLEFFVPLDSMDGDTRRDFLPNHFKGCELKRVQEALESLVVPMGGTRLYKIKPPKAQAKGTAKSKARGTKRKANFESENVDNDPRMRATLVPDLRPVDEQGKGQEAK